MVEIDAARLETLVGKPRFVAERSWTGVELDGLIVEGVIGAGGMGTVYRARSVREGEGPLAVKFLSPSLAAEPELVARFRREVALLEKEYLSVRRIQMNALFGAGTCCSERGRSL